MKVVDASVAVKWFVDEKGTEAAARLLTGDLVGPALLLGEVANTLVKKWRRAEVKREHAMAAIDNLSLLVAEFYPLEPLTRRAAAIAFDTDHPVYDCFYVALADQLQIAFVTADLKMIAKFAGTPWTALFEPLA